MENLPRILFINIYMHHKNLDAIIHYKYLNMTIITNQHALQNVRFSDYDVVYSPAILLPVKQFPRTKFIFGPHVSVFPNQNIPMIAGAPNALYIQPSEWARDAWRASPLARGVRLEVLPFGVDTARFCPRAASSGGGAEVFIYFKRRRPEELTFVEDFLRERHIVYRVFEYGSYKEEEYLEFLQTRARFGIWIGSHESQGFALLEALSCNVPLFVWDATSMNQEVGAGHPDVPATSAPYWDNRCGMKITQFSHFSAAFEEFMTEKLPTARPREYVLENVSRDVCNLKFLQLIDNF
jgi:glycosyltransferase involved in cell wall biosynthesis